MNKSALVYLLIITAAEVVTVSLHPVIGMTGYVLLLAALIVHAALETQPVRHSFLVTMTLIPLIRIISLSVPFLDIPQLWRYPIVYSPLLVTAFLIVRMLGYKMSEIGIQMKRVSVQLAIGMAGFFFGMIEYFILTGEAELTGQMMRGTWALSAFMLLVTTGVVEELIFRGILQRSVEGVLGRWMLVYVSYLFAIVHWIHRSFADLIFVFLVALFLGWAVKKTGSLFGVTLAHGIANIVLFLVAPVLF